MKHEYHNPTVERRELFNLMRTKFPKGIKEKQFHFSMTVRPEKVDYYIDLFTQHK
jgi:hypothetical protein